MGIIEFATCEVNRAFDYLKQVYPSREITKEMVSKLLDLVSKDILRIQDPYMYGNKIAVVAGNKYKPENKVEIDEAIKQLKENGLI